jgi:hypothetical protein
MLGMARALLASRPTPQLRRRVNRKALAHIDGLLVELLAAAFEAERARPKRSPFASFMLAVLEQWRRAVLWADEDNRDFYAVELSVAVLVAPLAGYADRPPFEKRDTVRLAQARALALVEALPRLAEARQKKARDVLRTLLPREGEPGHRREDTRPQWLERLCATHATLRAQTDSNPHLDGPGSWLSFMRHCAPARVTEQQWRNAGQAARDNWSATSEQLIVAVFEALGHPRARDLFSYRDKATKRRR